MSIEIKNLTKTYKKHLILDNLNLSIQKGSIFGLLGPNGAGKTTLVSILNFLINKNSGQINIEGFDLDKHGENIKSISSYVPQTYAFYPKLTTYENLEFFGALYGLKSNKLKERIDYCINATSLEKYINRQAYTYSGGLKRRLNIAIGLLNDPKILYLDEPTVGIDPQSRKYILNVIKNINKKKKTTIIYTSHYMEEVEFLCDEIAILDKGKIILQDKKDDLINKNSKITIKFDDETTTEIDIKNDYNKFTEYIKSLENRNIKNIDFGYKNLEEMFLNLTKQDLRD
ncbi:ABC transporter ATP-binding protein [Arcobacter sp. CECT 8985]|uniref:ABC transporter ATP-binding protein n=1 Tax=Arcobacter sp. CECT 8985 TaxID=1935424 RepID=UPI00100B45F1|nr:ABC transporter ATP-binding protein [Arcobacter sp. CECT 8985]RXJ85598.1 ABC transporter [Arcobacter sp. CECT 8985]